MAKKPCRFAVLTVRLEAAPFCFHLFNEALTRQVSPLRSLMLRSVETTKVGVANGERRFTVCKIRHTVPIDYHDSIVRRTFLWYGK